MTDSLTIMMLGWLKRVFGNSAPTGRMVLQSRFEPAPSRRGKSVLADKIAEVIAACDAEPGDIVEVDEHGTARVVGRRPRIVGEKGAMTEYVIRERLRKIYGDDVAYSLDVTNGSNVVVFRQSKHK